MNTFSISNKQRFVQVSQIRILSNVQSDNIQVMMGAGFANFTVLKKLVDLGNNHSCVKASLPFIGFNVFIWEMEVEVFP